MVWIRPATEGDDEFVVRLAKRADATVHPQRERLQPRARLLVAEIEEGGVRVPAGFVLGWVAADELEIIDLAVEPALRRRGIGERLLSFLIEETAAGGVATVFLEVRRSNGVAQALYKKLGFSEVGLRPRYYRGGEDALLFRCCLTERD